LKRLERDRILDVAVADKSESDLFVKQKLQRLYL
jgi:hypothetical protein